MTPETSQEYHVWDDMKSELLPHCENCGKAVEATVADDDLCDRCAQQYAEAQWELAEACY